MQKIIWKIYQNKYVGSILHSLMSTLGSQLDGCRSVLDLGCGHNSLLRHLDIEYSVGVDAYLPYIKVSKKLHIHNKYFNKEITKLSFKRKGFDAVILIDVLEHLTKKDGNELIRKMERWAIKKVVINTPNGYLPAYDSSNHYQSHKSGWTIEEMEKKGYRAYGMAGWKFLRKTEAPDNIKNECFVTMRFKPGSFWFLIAGITQFFTYHIPQLAFEVLYVKDLNEK